MGSPEVPCVNPVDLNDFFDGDGKIYGYHGLKVLLLFYIYIALKLLVLSLLCLTLLSTLFVSDICMDQ